MYKLDFFQVYADGSRNLLFAWIPSSSVSGHPCAPFYAERTWQGACSTLKLVQHGPKREVKTDQFMNRSRARLYGQSLLQLPRTNQKLDKAGITARFEGLITAIDVSATQPKPKQFDYPALITGRDTLLRIAQDWHLTLAPQHSLGYLIGPDNSRYFPNEVFP